MRATSFRAAANGGGHAVTAGLPVRMSWVTRDGDRVRIGDRVAIMSLVHGEAVGEIVQPLSCRRIDCHVTQTSCGPADFHLPVRERHLVCLLPEAEL